jgi:hypothetical protein
MLDILSIYQHEGKPFGFVTGIFKGNLIEVVHMGGFSADGSFYVDEGDSFALIDTKKDIILEFYSKSRGILRTVMK